MPVLGSQPAGDVSHKPGGSLPLPQQPLRRLLPISLLGEQKHNGCEQFAYKTVTRQRRGCDSNQGPSASSESSTLTTRLPNHHINTRRLLVRIAAVVLNAAYCYICTVVSLCVYLSVCWS